MPSLPTIAYSLISLASYGLSLNLPTNSALARNPLPPLPPPPPKPPIGPDNYPITGSDLTLRVQRPYGETLPHNPTILSLASAQSALSRRVASKGDAEFPMIWDFEEGGIKIVVVSVNREEMYWSDASTALRGVVAVMIAYPEVGTKALNAIVSNPEEILGRVEISRSNARSHGPSPSTSNFIASSAISTNLKARIDPTNFHIPSTSITISLLGPPPYGPPLPSTALILTLISASVATSQTIQTQGDISLPGLWRFEEGNIGIDIYTQIGEECKFSVLETGLLGLMDIVTEPGGVGSVAAEFVLREDGRGQVASGRLKLLDGRARAETSAVGSGMVNMTVAGGVVETGAAGTA